ncbi:hypothetical protein QC823_14520 [Halomonas vilamensis]|uniref:Uncharacterized protein n=1 Tax=Vreelandella vilamensis TaxID=531309 RepID=A0ABU1H7A6_9GAMM|nr:hypothetical protein [Halomonas vilamensis]MDR5900188.1 hypothetical protein [Halomonas vilamensis]
MTRQASDKLIWEGGNYNLEKSPGLPKQHKGLVERNSDQFPSHDYMLGFTQSTACQRGYIATWVVVEGKLYLKEVLGSRFLAAGPLLADWVSGKLLAPSRPLGQHINIRFTPDNIEYLRLIVEKGVVIDHTVGKGKGEPHHVSAG